MSDNSENNQLIQNKDELQKYASLAAGTIDLNKKVTIYDLNGDLYPKYSFKNDLYSTKEEALNMKRKRRQVRVRQSVKYDLGDSVGS